MAGISIFKNLQVNRMWRDVFERTR